MRKQIVSLVAASGSLLVAGLAHAQSEVVIYGNIDAGFVTQNHAASAGCTNAAGCQVTAFQDGQTIPSVFGFKGHEDLGNGYKAGFELEGGFTSNNGVNGLTSNNGGLFGRQAFVDISGSFGQVKIGQQFDPALYAALVVEPRGLTDSFSSLGAWVSAFAQGFVASNALGATANGKGLILNGVFDQNAVSYNWSGNGLNVKALYSFGGVAGNTSGGSIESLGVWYQNAGLTVSGGWNQAKDVSGNKAVQTEVLGAGYIFGSLAVRASYTDFKDYVAANQAEYSDTKVWGIGGDYTIGLNKINLSYYDAKNGDGTNDRTKWLALMDTYSLSKHTNVYAQVASVRADTGASLLTTSTAGLYVPGNALGSAMPGQTTTYFGIGIDHAF